MKTAANSNKASIIALLIKILNLAFVALNYIGWNETITSVFLYRDCRDTFITCVLMSILSLWMVYKLCSYRELTDIEKSNATIASLATATAASLFLRLNSLETYKYYLKAFTLIHSLLTVLLFTFESEKVNAEVNQRLASLVSAIIDLFIGKEESEDNA